MPEAVVEGQGPEPEWYWPIIQMIGSIEMCFTPGGVQASLVQPFRILVSCV
jgi:hypothetical protein